MEACMIESICMSLRLYMYSNAIFLCERLCAEFPSENNLHLLATCYFRSNQAYRAYHVLKDAYSLNLHRCSLEPEAVSFKWNIAGSKSEQCRYLFALACFEMDYLAEAEAALSSHHDPSTEVPNGAAGKYMLGLICRLTDRRDAAIDYYSQALSLDPFFWCAYEDLCLLGADQEAATLHGEAAVARLQQQYQQQQHYRHWDRQNHSSSSAGMNLDHFDAPYPLYSPRSPYANNGSPKHSKPQATASAADVAPTMGGHGSNASMSSHFLTTPSSFNTPSPGAAQILVGVPPAPARNVQGLPNNSMHISDSPRHPTATGSGQSQRRKFLDEGKLRKSIRSASTRSSYSQVSGRLFAEPVPRRSSRLNAGDSTGTTVHIGSSGPSVGSVGGLATGNGLLSATSSTSSAASKPGPGSSRSTGLRKSHSGTYGVVEGAFDEGGSAEDEVLSRSRTNVMASVASRASRLAEGLMDLLTLLRTLGEGFRHLCMYRCQEALQAFQKLPHQHFATGWVLCQVGRAYFEMVDYPEAERAFSWARRVAPYRLEGTDIYSTVLYHMKKEVQLSYLAQETVAMDRLSPQAWCVMGNAFSLQKDHEAALKFFQRALQLDSHFTYAHTLCGHECVAMEDFEEGLTHYRNAIRMDSRHYNAWYGLGTIYFRQEKYELAEYHFRRALDINSRSSVLHCYLGMAYHALKKNKEALVLLEQAMVADPKNPLPKYQKANVLMSEERYNEAMRGLEELKEVAPRESGVFFLMGKIYKRLDMPERAMYHFCIALDLKPSTADVNLIKTAIEKLHVPDDLEDENL